MKEVAFNIGSVIGTFNWFIGWGLIFVVLISCQFHLVLFQVGSWGWMMANYSEEAGSISDGIAMTFDGEHKCSGCRVVESMQQIENGDNRETGMNARNILVLIPLIPVINANKSMDIPKAREWGIWEREWEPTEIIMERDTPPPRA